MGDPRGQFPQQRETRVETHTREIRLDDEYPRERADVDIDRTPVSYQVEGGINSDGAWASLRGRARAGSMVERASASLLALTGTAVPLLAFGGLAHVAGASAAVTLTVAAGAWILAAVAAVYVTRGS
ncbi:MAG: hypothetical protein JK586_05325 [Nocardiopsis sp. BM-2018]|uniref:Uncharacterized protein n=1 Tax=Nocardiopsis metallicus TaxID=179819 RepID=A0A840WAI6_9ACTN|nr:hypothetical protein [Nocardiopsis metallicus]MBB5493164.1 hypothetical protein [Nocardiopsis metallicus]QRN80930.1 MAG: hypothetical protein JK586_05325 [Nocardiopsis sp. BM-2018]